MKLKIAQFRPRRAGPEGALEDAVVGSIPALFPSIGTHSWAASSLPIGAGIPDLLVIACNPVVFELSQINAPSLEVLAYLRSVPKARVGTIGVRTGLSDRSVSKALQELKVVGAVNGVDVFRIMPIWRNILPEVVTIEVKVANWRRAVHQAARNRIFSHRSFVALPTNLAIRVNRDPLFSLRRVGLLAVSHDNSVKILRPAPKGSPRVWSYYYYLASIIAEHHKGR